MFPIVDAYYVAANDKNNVKSECDNELQLTNESESNLINNLSSDSGIIIQALIAVLKLEEDELGEFLESCEKEIQTFTK